LLAGYSVFQFWWKPAAISAWIAVSALVFAYQALTLWRGFSLNRHEGEQALLLPFFGGDTVLILIRSILVGMLAGFAVLGPPFTKQPLPHTLSEWAPVLLYTLIVLGELISGYATSQGKCQTTLLGEKTSS